MLKKAKRLLSLLLVLTMLLSVMSGLSLTAFAGDKATITVENNKTVDVADGEVELSVSISNNPGFSGALLVVNVGEAPLTFKEATAGALIDAGMLDSGKNITIESKTNITGDGEILKLKFTINAGAQNGTYENAISLGLFENDADNFGNIDEENVDVEFVPATITITGAAEPSTVPVKVAGVQNRTATVKTGNAYLLSDLQSGKIFQAPAGGAALDVTNYYWSVSTDQVTWSTPVAFEAPMYGSTTLQVSQATAGTYYYKFTASYDGKEFSEPWCLTLNVLDETVEEYSFYVGQSPLGGTPVLKLYKGGDATGEVVDLGTPESIDGYLLYKVTLTSGRYSYRVSDNGVDLGGMALDLPTEAQVDSSEGGGNKIYLSCVQFTASAGGKELTTDQFTVEVNAPKTNCKPALSAGQGSYYAAYLWAGGNGCVYSYTTTPMGETAGSYTFLAQLNQTLGVSAAGATWSAALPAAVTLTVKYPEGYQFTMYWQDNYYAAHVLEPYSVNEAEHTAIYKVADSYAFSSVASWRLTPTSGSGADRLETVAGWLPTLSGSATMGLTALGGVTSPRKAFTSGYSLDGAGTMYGLGSEVRKRDEADLYVGLDSTGYKTLSGTERIRAYREWEIIDSDSNNLIIEPEFYWQTISGDATFTTANGGNGEKNWADITAGTEDSILGVSYGAMQIYQGTSAGAMDSAGTHGGAFPAVSQNRCGVMVIGGTGVTHGTAKAYIGGDTTKTWDYNYDTWYYTANDATLSFTTDSSVQSVETTYVTFSKDVSAAAQTTTLTATEGEDGAYSVTIPSNVSCADGGTVVIKMTDANGAVSYQLVRVAKVTVTVENLSGKSFYTPGDRVKISFKGLYRGLQKMSGIFNPTTLNLNYKDASSNSYSATAAQYQRMDLTTVELQIPAMSFAEDQKSAAFTLTGNGISGSQYARANPFRTIYDEVTDDGLAKNFNAVDVTYNFGHLPEITINVMKEDLTGDAWDGTTRTAPTKNDDGWYEIYTPGELAGFADLVNGGEASAKGKLMADINLNDKSWTPIGNVRLKTPFKGCFDGQNHSITGLNVSATSKVNCHFGLFGIVTQNTNAVTIQNFTLQGSVTVSGSIAQESNAGGVIGFCNKEGSGLKAITLQNITSNVTVNGKGGKACNAGGLVGGMDNGVWVNFTQCANLGDVTSGYQSGEAGGIAAKHTSPKAYGMDRCYNAGTILSPVGRAGGLAGYVTGATIKNSYNVGTVSTNGSGKSAGGLAGETTMQGCDITYSYNTGTVSAANGVAGGLVGTASAYTQQMKGNYSVGTVTGSQAGALFGKWTASVTPENNFYLSGQNASGDGNAVNGATAEETKEALTSAVLEALPETTNSGYKADSGNVNQGYPILWWQSTEACTHPAKKTECISNGNGTHTYFSTCKVCGDKEKGTTEDCENNGKYVCSKCGDKIGHEHNIVNVYTRIDMFEHLVQTKCTLCDQLIDETGYKESHIEHNNEGTVQCRECKGECAVRPEQDSEGYYLLTNRNKLFWFASKVNSGELSQEQQKARVTQDIKVQTSSSPLSWDKWTPIGTQEHPFTGIFDGQGYTLDSMAISVRDTADNLLAAYGMFGFAGSSAARAEIKNLTVNPNIDVDVTGGTDKQIAVGGLIGVAENVHVTDVFSSSAGASGKVYVDDDDRAVANIVVGGLIGEGKEGMLLENSANYATVSLTNRDTKCVGGLVGLSSGTIQSCYNSAEVSCAAGTAGGLVGIQLKGTVSDCYTGTSEYSSRNNVTSRNGVAGGLAGEANGTFERCYSAATVTGATSGLAFGKNDSETGKTCYTKADEAADFDKNNAVSVTDEALKALKPTLGDAFANDAANINTGYPILLWQCTHTVTETVYVNNGDGTHTETVLCKGCGAKQSEKAPEACADEDNDGKCDKCETAMPKTVTSIAVKAGTAKTTYTEGDTFDKSDMVLEVTYSDGTTEEISANDDVTVEPAGALKTSDSKVTIKYGDKTTELDITVNAKPKTVTSITVKAGTAKTTYTEGDTFDKSDMVLEVTYSDGTTEEISANDDVTVEPAGALTTSDSKVTIKYGDKTTELTITVNAKQQPGTTEFTVTFDARGGTASADSMQTVNGKLTKLPTASRTRYTFLGWFLADGTRVTTKTEFTSDTTVYAHWSYNGSNSGSSGSGSTTKPAQNEQTKLPFYDVASKDWFYDGVSYAYEKGLMNGTATHTFSPYANTTRGMIVTILARLEGVDTSKSSPWYAAGREWAMNNAVSDGTNMTGEITREQLAAMLYRYAKAKGYDVSAAEKLDGYTDASSVSAWAVEAMQWAVAEGLIQGSGKQLNPQAPATRAQVATILMRFTKLVEKK